MVDDSRIDDDWDEAFVYQTRKRAWVATLEFSVYLLNHKAEVF